MVLIILKGCNKSNELKSLVEKTFRTNGKTRDKDLLLNPSDIKIGKILKICFDKSIEGDSRELANLLYEKIPKTVTIKGKNTNKSQLNDIYDINNCLTLADNKADILDIIEKSILYMKDCHSMSNCMAVLPNTDQFGMYTKLIKNIYLFNEFGDNKAKKKIKNNYINNIIPGVFEPIEYIDTLTRMTPFAISLSLFRYEGLMFLFYGESIIKFNSRWKVKSIFSELMLSYSSPVSNSNDDYSNIFRRMILKSILD